VHPKVLEAYDIATKTYALMLDLTPLLGRIVKVEKAKAAPKLPTVERDIALLVNEKIPVGDILHVVNEGAKGALASAEVFDIYVGSQVGMGRKSVAIKLQIKQRDKTLSDEEIGAIMKQIVSACSSMLKAELRGEI
jgi:phenylalanyl-tRNA synthetase beta chain